MNSSNDNCKQEGLTFNDIHNIETSNSNHSEEKLENSKYQEIVLLMV